MTGIDTSEWSDKEKERFDLFALLPEGELDEGWINLHLLLWKYIIAAMVRVDTEEETFSISEVWRAAWTRMQRKMLALHERKKTVILRALSRGEEEPDMSEAGSAMEPIASLDAEGKLKWNKELVKKIKAQIIGN